MDVFAELNQEQAEAVRRSQGPLLILAGAGSGKTRVIAAKIAYLVSELGADPRSILAVTFTNKAAGEMRQRVAAMLDRGQHGEAAQSILIRTFHSFGSWFLRRNPEAAGLSASFVIYDDDDALGLLGACYPERNRSALQPYQRAISRAKDYLLGPDDAELGSLSSLSDLGEVYAAYQARLRRSGNVDFGDLIIKPRQVLAEKPAILARFRQRFRYILVDEYQDSNQAQFELLKTLYEEGQHLCVVGDDDQSIYRFRGAEIRNILTFPDSFPGTQVVRLVRNYRSFGPILQAAHAVVSRNQGRMGKELLAVRQGGEEPELACLENQDAEALYCARRATALMENGARWADTAILFRTNAQSLSFETVFTRLGLPFRVIGSLKFYDREEIKDVLSFLSFLVNPRDEVGFRRIVNKPARGIGEGGLARVVSFALDQSLDFLQVLDADIGGLAKRAQSGLKEFQGLSRRLLNALDVEKAPLYKIVQDLVVESGLGEYHRQHEEIGGGQRIANLEELANAASRYPEGREGLVAFLEAIALDRSREDGLEKEDAVNLITIHNTKGLEFRQVIVTGLEQGIFPRYSDGTEDIEEQRRLFYVAMTRAMDSLAISFCRSRRIHGREESMEPSMFLFELPPALSSKLMGAGAAYGDQAPGSAFQVGSGVFHEDYGPGQVIQKKLGPDGLSLVVVRFSSGLSMRFIPAYDKKLELASE